MAKNTGWLRFNKFQSTGNVVDNIQNLEYTYTGEATTDNGAPNTVTIDRLQNSTVDPETGSLYEVIPEGSNIEGIEFQIKAKVADTTITRVLKVNFTFELSSFTVASNVSSDEFNLTTSHQIYTLGGPTNLLGCEKLSLPNILDSSQAFLQIQNTSPLTTYTFEGNYLAPGLRIWYDPPPPQTRASDWIKFTNVYSHSNNWTTGTVNDLLLEDTGSLLFVGAPTPDNYYFILNSLDSSGYSSIPPDSIITGIQVRVPGYLNASGSQILGKLSLNSFNSSSIIDTFYSFGFGISTYPHPNTTGSYNNLFGLEQFGTLNPIDLGNLHLGIKTGPVAYSFGEFYGLEPRTGTYPNTNIEKIGPAIKVFYIPPFAKTNLSITSGRGDIESGKLSLQ